MASIPQGNPTEDLSRPGFLAIAERGIGDALTLLPSLRALRGAQPDLRIDLLTPGLFPLAENLRSTATVLDHRPIIGLLSRERLAWLGARNTHWVWNTEGEQGLWTRAVRGSARRTWVNALPQQCWGAGYVVRVRFEQLRMLFPELREPGRMGLSLTPVQRSERDAFRAGFPQGQLLVAIHPGAGDPNRAWPTEKFRALALALAERPDVTVLLFLSDTDAIFRTPGYLADLPNLRCVSEPLRAALSKLAACDLFIGNDSGFYHLAFNLGLRVVGVYRSLRSAQRWSHRSPRSRAVVCWMPHQLDRDWTRWVSVRRVLRAVRRLGVA